VRLAPLLFLSACVPIHTPSGWRHDATATQVDADVSRAPTDARNASLDAERREAGPPDSGAEDGGHDGGLPRDASRPDATETDAGLTDAQSTTCDPTQHQHPNTGRAEEPGVDGCPSSMVRVETFCVDRFEASLVEVRQDGSTVGWSPYHHPGARTVRAVSVRGAVPQGYIDGDTAARACAQAGKRLCTNAEWLRACQGPQGLTFPYGATRQDGVCNDARARHPAVELFPNDPNPFARIQDACINQLPDSVDRTSVNPGCKTPEDIFDMMGNLHEWTADPSGTFRGGFYVDTRRNGPGCLYRTTAHNTLH
jgi:formylglycine-generating enzyme